MPEVARLAGKHSRAAEFHRTRRGPFTWAGAASYVDGAASYDETAHRQRGADLCRGVPRSYPRSAGTEPLDDRRPRWGSRAVGTAAHHLDLQDAQTRYRTTTVPTTQGSAAAT